ncbi:5616_t:CDS:2 [Paraglomus occultum]|uniref:5616_t:CDS:1 n=1 Tax=Paraglomus occultum TaxID=144539 RepID=A0A9N9A562_9GLOM|nr:5616_t:CDS:2 [Paraglomus occultum]
MSASTRKKDAIRRKLVIVGDGACGKTSLLNVFTLGYFPKDYVPTVFDNLVTDIKIDGRLVQLALWDTAGQEDYERLRPLSYSKAHVILIGFAVNAPDSFESVTAKWIGEVNSLCPDIPVILVGLKKDLRENPESKRLMEESNISFVDSIQGEAVAQQIGARKYIECSALSGENVNDVFEAATRAALLSSAEIKPPCCDCVVL